MEGYFVLYDMNDNIICYIENFEELRKYLPNYRVRDIRRRFLNNSFIKIIFNNTMFKIYKFN